LHSYNNLSFPIVGDTNAVRVNLTPGSHTVSWKLHRDVLTYGTNLIAFKFTRLGNVSIPNCAGVRLYGYSYPGDFTGDCIEDIYDLDVMATNWLNKE
jgi:hypothetical protein